MKNLAYKVVSKPVYKSDLLKAVVKYRSLGPAPARPASLGEGSGISASSQLPGREGPGFSTTRLVSLSLVTLGKSQTLCEF